MRFIFLGEKQLLTISATKGLCSSRVRLLKAMEPYDVLVSLSLKTGPIKGSIAVEGVSVLKIEISADGGCSTWNNGTRSEWPSVLDIDTEWIEGGACTFVEDKPIASDPTPVKKRVASPVKQAPAQAASRLKVAKTVAVKKETEVK